MSLFVLFILDTDVGSTTSNKSPFAVDIPGSCGYMTRMINGVMTVYADQSSLDKDAPLNYPRPDLAQFLTDQNLLFCLIADGPLYVFNLVKVDGISEKLILAGIVPMHSVTFLMIFIHCNTCILWVRSTSLIA